MEEEVLQDVNENTQNPPSIENIAEEMAENMPTAQEYVKESQQVKSGHENEGVKQPDYSHWIDADGRRFDPEINIIGPDGQPKRTKKGYFARKRGHHKPAPQSVKSPQQMELEKKQEETKRAQASRMMAAEAAKNAFFQTGRILGGDEWEPITGDFQLPDGQVVRMDEGKDVTGAFYVYFEAKGIDDFPPGVALLVTLGNSVAIRMTKPKTQNTIQKLWGAIKKRVGVMMKNRTNTQPLSRGFETAA